MTTTRNGFEQPGGQAFLPRLAPARPPSHHRDWAAIRVVHAELDPGGPMTPPGHRRVRAALRLGALTPADVQVYLTSAAADLPWKTRMTCGRAYGNGTYLFEVLAPDERARGPEALRLQVERRAPLGAPDGRAGSLLLALEEADDR